MLVTPPLSSSETVAACGSGVRLFCAQAVAVNLIVHCQGLREDLKQIPRSQRVGDSGRASRSPRRVGPYWAHLRDHLC